MFNLPVLLLPFVYPCTKKGKDLDLIKEVYDKGSEMMDIDFDLYKIIRKLNQMNSFIKILLTREDKRNKNLYYNHRNIINLESDEIQTIQGNIPSNLVEDLETERPIIRRNST